jgi:hypothetical protein
MDKCMTESVEKYKGEDLSIEQIRQVVVLMDAVWPSDRIDLNGPGY